MSASRKSIQFPPQTGPYKVFVKDKCPWQLYKKARLQISMVNPKHDGDKFFALAEWAAARFDHVNLIVSDTLHRHNIAFQVGCDAILARQASLELGEQWLLRNQHAIALIPRKTIIRWDHYTNHSDYNAAHKYIGELYKLNDKFRNSVIEKAHEFSFRNYLGANDNPASDALIETSINYILEEIAVFSLMFRDERAVDIYPGSWFKEVFESLKQIGDNDMLQGFFSAECLRVDFVRNRSPLSSILRGVR